MVSDLNISHEKVSDIVSFSFFRFTFVIKQKNFDFTGHQNTSIFSDKKNDVRFDHFLSNSVSFDLRFVL